jgi:hypothetical protein
MVSETERDILAPPVISGYHYAVEPIAITRMTIKIAIANVAMMPIIWHRFLVLVMCCSGFIVRMILFS